MTTSPATIIPNSINDYRERNFRALQALDFNPDKPLAQYDLPARRGRPVSERVLDLLSERAELELLSSTQHQREAYGVERWHREFVRVGAQKAPENSLISDEAFRAALWRAVPNGPFKRFQEAFSDPEHFVVPPYQVGPRNTVTFAPQIASHLRTLSVQGCLVCADRIPDSLVSDLGLVSFDGMEGDPYARLRAKARPEVIAGLKQVWDSAESLQRQHYRILVVREPRADIRAKYKDAAMVDPENIGTILYSREQTAGDTAEYFRTAGARSVVVQHFDSLYAACRKTDHENRLYDAELRELSELRTDLVDLNKRIDREWRRDTPREVKDDLKSMAQERLNHAAEVLSGCVNQFKLDAAEYAVQSATFADKSGRENVSATLTRMVASITGLERRLTEMRPKSGFNNQDRLVLSEARGGAEYLLKDFRGSVVKAAEIISRTQLNLFSNSPLSSLQVDTAVTGFLARTGLRAARLDGLDLMPGKVFADAWNSELEHLNRALHERNLGATEESLIRMHVIGKFSAVLVCFEHMKSMLHEGSRVPLRDIHDFAARLGDLLAERGVFGGRVVQQLVQPFTELQETLEALNGQLEEYGQQNISVDDQARIYKQLKSFLDGYTIVDRVRALAV